MLYLNDFIFVILHIYKREKIKYKNYTYLIYIHLNPRYLLERFKYLSENNENY